MLPTVLESQTRQPPSSLGNIRVAKLTEPTRYNQWVAETRELIRAKKHSPAELLATVTDYKSIYTPALADVFQYNERAMKCVNKIAYSNDTDCFPYMPTDGDQLARVLQEAQPKSHDVFIDLGAGSGFTCAAVHALTGCRVVGIEIQPGLYKAAEELAASLNFSSEVSFRLGDVRDVTFEDGTIFYLFNPFHGKTLQNVVDRLHKLSAQKAIKIALSGWSPAMDDFRSKFSAQSSTLFLSAADGLRNSRLPCIGA